MAEVVYQSDVRVERIKGPFRHAYLPVKTEPIFFGVHSEIAEHYNTDMSVHEPHPATLDYVVAATTG
mgnify:CR=1 FL=1